MENSLESKDKKITVSVATIDDVNGIQKVFHDTWLKTYPNEEFGITVDDIEDKFSDRFTEEGIKKATEKIINPLEGSTTFVAKEGDTVVGVCRILISRKENRLGALYVLPDSQKKGIGKKLWEQAQKLFDPTKDTFVSVVTYNTNAIEFYKSLGFEDTGKRWNDEKRKMKSGTVFPEMEMVIEARKSQ
jgi:ribosomal protein S18 acetylase RimI-like enzyme